MQDTILIIVPTLNSYLVLPLLINSLNNQTSELWRVIFVDGKSSKNHKKYLKNLTKQNSKFITIDQIEENPGIYGAMNIGLKYRKKNEWLLFWGSDDLAFSKFTIENLIKKINNPKFNNLDLIFHDAIYIDKFGSKKRESNFKLVRGNLKLSFFLGFSPAHQACLFSPNVFKIRNKYSNNYYLAADLDYFLSIANKNDNRSKYISEKIVMMGKGGASGRMVFKRLKEVTLIYKKFFGTFFLFLLFRDILLGYINT